MINKQSVISTSSYNKNLALDTEKFYFDLNNLDFALNVMDFNDFLSKDMLSYFSVALFATIGTPTNPYGDDVEIELV